MGAVPHGYRTQTLSHIYLGWRPYPTATQDKDLIAHLFRIAPIHTAPRDTDLVAHLFGMVTVWHSHTTRLYGTAAGGTALQHSYLGWSPYDSHRTGTIWHSYVGWGPYSTAPGARPQPLGTGPVGG